MTGIEAIVSIYNRIKTLSKSKQCGLGKGNLFEFSGMVSIISGNTIIPTAKSAKFYGLINLNVETIVFSNLRPIGSHKFPSSLQSAPKNVRYVLPRGIR